MILYIKHIDIEGPETLGVFARERGFSSRTVELYRGEALPDDLDGVEAVVCLGGPMNVYEEQAYPYLKEETAFIRRVLEEKVPYLGLCLGSQLLAKAAGGRVVKSPGREIGWGTVSLNEAGRRDPLFDGIAETIEVYQWHEDMWELAPGAVLLASSALCPHQAFRIGPCAYGLQFHVEITEKSIRDWTERYWKRTPDREEEARAMMELYRQKEALLQKTAYRMYENFFNALPAPHRCAGSPSDGTKPQ